ncbi:MAG: hypothetical protein HOQ24_05460 [Mycobacteriaceae bacterium]|nr:hypothetical protein [Mycobacteriaceae bacterium]
MSEEQSPFHESSLTGGPHRTKPTRPLVYTTALGDDDEDPVVEMKRVRDLTGDRRARRRETVSARRDSREPDGQAGLARSLLAFVLFAAVLALLAGGALAVVRWSRADTATAQSVPAAPACPDRVDGTTVLGAGPGGQDSGPGAILWFQHSYYVERSGARARQVVSPDALVTSAETIQAGINELPVRTTHCLRIKQNDDQHFSVAITEQQPNRPAKTFWQNVTVRRSGDGTVITAITPG